MKPTLKEYLKVTAQSYEVFAQKLGITRQRVEQIANGDTLGLETALAVYKASDYEIRFSSLYPKWEKFRNTVSHIEDESCDKS